MRCIEGVWPPTSQVVDGSAAKRHAPSVAHWIREAMVARRVLLATDGPYANVLKVKPPMCFRRAEADHLVQQLAQARACFGVMRLVRMVCRNRAPSCSAQVVAGT